MQKVYGPFIDLMFKSLVDGIELDEDGKIDREGLA